MKNLIKFAQLILVLTFLTSCKESVNKEKLRSTLRSANDLKGTTKLF